MTNINLPGILNVVKSFGQEGGAGADSIAKAALFATGAAALKLIGEGDVKALYAAYREGYEGADWFKDAKPENLKVQHSLFLTFLKPDVVRHQGIHERALKIREGIDAKARNGSLYVSLVKLNREQIKVKTRALTDEEIRAVMTKAAPVEKDELAKLEALLKTLTAHDDKFGGMLDAIAHVERRIQAVKAAAIEEDAEEEGESEEVNLQDNPPVDPLAALLSSVTQMTAPALPN